NAIAASGPVELDLNIQGNLRQRSPAAYSGVVGMKRVSLSYAGLTGFASGRAAFDDNAVLLDSIIVKHGQSNIRIAGSITGYKAKNPAFDLTVEGTAGGRAFKEVLPDALKDLSIDGQTAFRLALKGRARDYSIAASTDLTAAGISYKGIVKKDSGYPAQARLAAELKQGGIEIQALALAFGGSSVKISGKAGIDKPGYALSIASERLLVHDIAHLSPYLEKSATANGAVHVDIVVSSNNAGKSYKGNVSVTDAEFSSAHFERPFEGVNARAVFMGNSADIKITGLKTGSTEMRAGIEVSDIKERLVRFEVDSPGIDLDEALKTGAWQSIFSGNVPQADSSGSKLVKGAGIVRADRLKLKGLVMKGLSFAVELDEKEARLKDMAFGLNSGSASGGLIFMRSPDDPLLFRLGMDFFNVNVQELIKDLGAKGKAMSGELNARVDLTGEKAKIPVSSGFNGKISLEARDGRLWKFLTLSKIFSVVNIISISELFEDGYPYREVTGDFLVKDGIMTTGNLMLDAASMRMSAAGEIRLPAREIDGLLGLHPFVTIDKIITNIPVAGWIIGGKEKSTVSMYYDVKGPLKNPSIEPAPIKSIEKGILGVLERLIEAPVL
ncbi:MAG: AsmA-like C-terminal region-containing protein, partial [Deltaproteobacteria bacterium]|nr:AsmA-like C-terminal region-containing protein [Deltaproteobacteria bacterium]